jgi:flagellar motor switch protein FliG
MGVYARFKRDPNGFRRLVELLEATPKSRRDRMIEVGHQEDRDYTEKAMSYMMTFEDVLKMPDAELAELMAAAPTRVIGTAISRAPEDVRERFLRNCPLGRGGEVKDYIKSDVALSAIGGAQLKLVEITRGLERQGLIKTKQIPVSG